MSTTEPTRDETEEAFALEIDKYDDALMAAESVVTLLLSPEGEPHLRALASEILDEETKSLRRGFHAAQTRADSELANLFDMTVRANAAEAALAEERAKVERWKEHYLTSEAACDDMHVERCEALAERDRLAAELRAERATVERVKSLHTPDSPTGCDDDFCTECFDAPWPCPTVRAIEGKDEDQAGTLPNCEVCGEVLAKGDPFRGVCGAGCGMARAI